MFRQITKWAICVALGLASFLIIPSADAQVPVVTGYSSGVTRNDYSGFVGMRFTVGVSPITLYSLGRPAFAGNSGTHTLKLVDASTGLDMPGGSVQLALNVLGVDNFQYADLANPIVLSPGASYLLLSQETAGGDTWQDLGPITTIPDLTVTGAVYTVPTNMPVVAPGSGGLSYGPLNFLYKGESSSQYPSAVTDVPGFFRGLSSPTYPEFLASVTPSAGATITSIRYQLDNQNFGLPGAYNIFVPNVVSGTYALTAVVTDSNGLTARSKPVSYTLANSTKTLVNGQTPTSLRNDYGDANAHFVGLSFTTGAQDLLVFELGRYVVPGNNKTHLMKLVNAASGADVPGGSVTLSLADVNAGQYVYGYLPAPLQLRANTTYYLLSQETASGDQWYDVSPVTPSTLASVNGPVYQDENGAFVPVQNVGPASYGPLNMGASPVAVSPNRIVPETFPTGSPNTGPFSGTFQFIFYDIDSDEVTGIGPALFSVQTLIDGQPVGPANDYSFQDNYSYLDEFVLNIDSTQLTNGPHTIVVNTIQNTGLAATYTQTLNIANPTSGQPSQPFVAAFQPTFLRNNYSGWVGLAFTTGTTPKIITSLGRFCVAGNGGVHVVKLVRASDNTDVPGGTVSIPMVDCVPGQFMYQPILNSVTLPAGTSYYLVSQEINGADQWYDYLPVAASGASETGSVYFNGSTYVTVPAASTSFGPVDFLSRP